METNTVQFFTLECITHLHAGSGDEAYDYVDKRVQKDPITGWPCINSSSLKGALREHFVQQYWPEEENEENNTIISNTNARTIFGTSIRESTKKTQQGQYRFLSAKLLSIPIRSNTLPYFHSTCPAIAKEILHQLQMTRASLPEETLNALGKLAELPEGTFAINAAGTTFLEDWETDNTAPTTWNKKDIEALENLMGSPLAILTNNQFGSLMETLPVMARNQLENGESKNLWYEEIVPRQTRFWTLMIVPPHPVSEFHDILGRDTIQIGANATIGYGLTKFQQIQAL